MQRITRLFSWTVLLSISPLASALQVTAILREGDVLEDGTQAAHVWEMSATANDMGGYMSAIRATDGQVGYDRFWGSRDGTTPGLLHSHSRTVASYWNSSMRTRGVSNGGSVVFETWCATGGLPGCNSAWLDSTALADEGTPVVGMPGMFFTESRWPGITGSGQPYFMGGFGASPSNPAENWGLFYGTPPLPVLTGGGVVPGLPEPLGFSVATWAPQFSGSGTHYIASVVMAGPTITAATATAMVVDGAGMRIGGSLVQSGTPIPAIIGGLPRESWIGFGSMGITDSGESYFSAITSAAPGFNRVIVHNGVIRFRMGDTVDSKVLLLGPSVAMNSRGEIAHSWRTSDGVGGTRAAVFVEDELLFEEGDLVDWDGDGDVDMNHELIGFSSLLPALTIGSDGVVYFAALVRLFGSEFKQAFFAVPTQDYSLSTYCFPDGLPMYCPCGNQGSVAGGGGCSNSSGNGAALEATGAPDFGEDTLRLHVTHAPPGVPGIFFAGGASQGYGVVFGDGFLCAASSLSRLELSTTDAGGDTASTVSLSAVGALSPGDLRFYQFWFRDPVGPCGSGFNTSNGLRVQW